MYQVDAGDWPTQFEHWFAAAQRVETIVIVHEGQPIARLMPDSAERHQKAKQALKAIRALRKTPGHKGRQAQT